MSLAEKLLPQDSGSDAPHVDPAVLGDLRSKLQALLGDMRRDRPESESDPERAMLARMSLFGLEAMRAFGSGYVALLRTGIHAALGDLVRRELGTADVERKLALRHLEQAVHTLGVLTESLGPVLSSASTESLTALFQDALAQITAGHVVMSERERVVARFQLDVLVAMDAMDAPVDELAFWAHRAITGAHKVNTIPGAEIVRGLQGDLARLRARRAWQSWDDTELAEELAPWPGAPSQ